MPLRAMSLPARQRVRSAVWRVAAPFVLRLYLQRRATADELMQFRYGLEHKAERSLPMLQLLLALPDGHERLRYAASYVWHQQRGTLDPAGPPDLGGDLLTAWTGLPVGFLHVEKSGGIALMQWLSRQFHPEQINSDPWRDLPPHLFYRAAQLNEPARRSALLWGHFDLPLLQRCGAGRFIFTMLREPQARLFSLYHYWRSLSPALFDPKVSFAVALAHRLPLEDFLNSEEPMIADTIDNVYVRRLTGLYATGAMQDPLTEAPDTALNMAVNAMETLGFTGITEHMDASLRLLAVRLGVPAPIGLARANITAENHDDPNGWFQKVPRARRTPGVEAALQRRTQLDQELYARALEKLRSEVEIF